MLLKMYNVIEVVQIRANFWFQMSSARGDSLAPSGGDLGNDSRLMLGGNQLMVRAQNDDLRAQCPSASQNKGG